MNKNNKLTGHELADLLIKLGLIGKLLKKLEDQDADILERLIKEEDIDKIVSGISYGEKSLKQKRRKKTTKIKKYNIDTRNKAEELENYLCNIFEDMKREKIIKYVKKEYKHVIPLCSSKHATIEEAIDVALMSKDYPIDYRSLPFDKKIKPEELRKKLWDRHEFPNRFAFFRLGKKLGINLNGKLSKDEMIDKILDARYGSLDKWYRAIEKL